MSPRHAKLNSDLLGPISRIFPSLSIGQYFGASLVPRPRLFPRQASPAVGLAPHPSPCLHWEEPMSCANPFAACKWASSSYGYQPREVSPKHLHTLRDVALLALLIQCSAHVSWVKCIDFGALHRHKLAVVLWLEAEALFGRRDLKPHAAQQRLMLKLFQL